jgi:single-strand DNA-binding protein
MNVFCTVARLGKDAELRFMPNGDSVIQFTAAFDSGYGDKKVTTWLNCALFGKRASENLCQYLTKGTQVALSGEIKLDEWRGNDGTTQKTLKMRVNELTLLSRTESAGGGGSARPNANPAGGQGADSRQTQPMADDFPDESIPF